MLALLYNVNIYRLSEGCLYYVSNIDGLSVDFITQTNIDCLRVAIIM